MTKLILVEEGLFGLYTGVWGTMAGQAVIKACAFWSNSFALNFLLQGRASASLVELALAAGFCGFVTSFVVNPIERIKVILQSKVNTNIGSDNYWRCFLDVLSTDGVGGLMFRGIEATLLREIPGYGF
jgi:solute carrier family 25 carnitine/acylcarnitine transporter 20/29